MNISLISKNDHELFIKNNSNSSYPVERIYENKSEENLSCENVNSQVYNPIANNICQYYSKKIFFSRYLKIQ